MNLDFGRHEDEKLSYRTAALNLTSKIKTRGQSSQETTNGETGGQARETAKAQGPLFILKKRVYKVFTILFHHPSVHYAPGEIAWNDFLHAMSSIDLIPEKLYGSVWRFAPGAEAKFGVENAIHFQEPHPSGKLSFHTARRYRRRLDRMYGLDASSFELADVGESTETALLHLTEDTLSLIRLRKAEFTKRFSRV